MITEDTHSIKGVFTHAVKTLKSDLKNVKGAGLTAGLFKVVWCLYLSEPELDQFNVCVPGKPENTWFTSTCWTISGVCPLIISFPLKGQLWLTCTQLMSL